MQLIEEIEISYFRSFYKFKLRHLTDLNVIFGRNDSGKSNVVRALNLFFSQEPDHTQPFDFAVDFCERRRAEAEASEDVRKFLYVKVTFNTPPSFQRSLGKSFHVKRQWTVSRGQEYHEEISSNIPSKRRHIATRFMNQIKFIYIPAIKDIRIFEMLLAEIHESIAKSKPFVDAVDAFTHNLQDLTSEMFSGLPKSVSNSTKIGPPTQLSQLFKTLDFETTLDGELTPRSLTRQRGDGVKVRHIPELLNFISQNDSFDYHIWGFEEPENSLDFSAAQSEAPRLLALAKSDEVQIFVTTHSPSFYLLEDPRASKFYVTKNAEGLSDVLQGGELKRLNAQEAIGEGFYLPAVADALKNVAAVEVRARETEAHLAALKQELKSLSTPIVLTEGRTDAKILMIAWRKLYGGQPPFAIRSCETSDEDSGGNGGASNLSLRLRGIAADSACPVIGLFDADGEGQKAFQLDRNFETMQIADQEIKVSKHKKAFAIRLSAPEFREDCRDHGNLPIEYLFRDEHLSTEVDGKCLTLNRPNASIMIGTRRIEKPLDDVTHLKTVGKGKVDFANVIVPTFPAEAFDGFEPTFGLIKSIIEFANACDD